MGGNRKKNKELISHITSIICGCFTSNRAMHLTTLRSYMYTDSVIIVALYYLSADMDMCKLADCEVICLFFMFLIPVHNGIAASVTFWLVLLLVEFNSVLRTAEKGTSKNHIYFPSVCLVWSTDKSIFSFLALIAEVKVQSWTYLINFNFLSCTLIIICVSRSLSG